MIVLQSGEDEGLLAYPQNCHHHKQRFIFGFMFFSEQKVILRQKNDHKQIWNIKKLDGRIWYQKLGPHLKRVPMYTLETWDKLRLKWWMSTEIHWFLTISQIKTTFTQLH